MVQEADAVNVSDRVHLHKSVMQGPHGEEVVSMTMDEDLEVERMAKKNELNGFGKGASSNQHQHLHNHS